ncbi:hypothetical protein GGR56DRAFT_631737 [Xylariaceae sp. FL0804]|nr:hypothetical protein GGR56DRAFT_631737 [Xylariaceae sp. FL0804]
MEKMEALLIGLILAGTAGESRAELSLGGHSVLHPASTKPFPLWLMTTSRARATIPGQTFYCTTPNSIQNL